MGGTATPVKYPLALGRSNGCGAIDRLGRVVKLVSGHRVHAPLRLPVRLPLVNVGAVQLQRPVVLSVRRQTFKPAQQYIYLLYSSKDRRVKNRNKETK